MLGRSLRPSLILENVGERFELRDAMGLPQLVSSVAVADVNSDGLLDIYWSTYAASMIERLRDLGGDVVGNAMSTLQGFMGSEEAGRLAGLVAADSFDFYLERPGPQNRLMINRGDWSFERSDKYSNLSVLRNTYQAGFSDIDLDGDPDLYLANDFSPNQLLKPRGPGLCGHYRGQRHLRFWLWDGGVMGRCGRRRSVRPLCLQHVLASGSSHDSRRRGR